MHLDDTACNLASLNLGEFVTPDGRVNLEDLRHAVRIWTVVLEISVLMASFPSRSFAEKSYKFRTLGLGYANLGTILMRQGIPYDSQKALAICGAITAIMTGEAYATSAEMAARLGLEGVPTLEDAASLAPGGRSVSKGAPLFPRKDLMEASS